MIPRMLNRQSLEVELASLKGLLEDAVAANDIIGQIQTRDRIEEIENILLEDQAENPKASVALIFSGNPVLGSLGIKSDFAGKVLSGFQDLVSKTFAIAELGSLGERGRVPLTADTSLMVTGLAQGSFGFVLNELSDQAEAVDTALKSQVKAVEELIATTGGVSEESFEQAAENLDRRSLLSLRDIFKELSVNKSTMRIVDDDLDLFLSEDDISRGLSRTESTDITEQTVMHKGQLIGFLPEHKTFEFLSDTGEMIYGSATPEATDQFDFSLIASRCEVELLERNIRGLRGEMRTVYRLVSIKVSTSGDDNQQIDITLT